MENYKHRIDIEELIEKGETQNLEFKESLRLKDEIGETVSAFSNSDGGVVLVGVSDGGGVPGVDVGKNTLEELANYIKRNTDPQVFPRIEITETKDGEVILIDVAENQEKPVFFKEKAYKRVGKTNQRISTSEIRRLAREERRRLSWDEQICEEAGREDVDEEKVRLFLKIANEERNLRIGESIPTKEALRKLKLVKEDKFTNAAILLFGKEPQRFFTQSEVRCARFKGDEAVKPFVDMKVFGGDILNQVDKALNFTLEHIPKSVWLIPGRPEREEKYLYPPDAVREAIINAICHRDYESVSNVQIRVFDDRVEVWNPGALPDGWTVEKLKEEHESVPKNPLIADHFFLTRLIEKWGTGTIEMIRQCEEWGVPEPEFKDTGTSIVVTFRKSEFTEEFLDSLNLNERQKKAVEFINTGKKITRSEYEKMFGISERTANREISDLVKLSIFNKIGKGPNVYYGLTKISPNLAKSRQKDA
jgi:ATP-dependent DNA helicase RecG